MSDWIKDEEPKARKDYRCFLCGETIPKGEKHTYRVMRDGSELFSFRMHFECEKYAQDNYSVEDWECHESCEFKRPVKDS